MYPSVVGYVADTAFQYVSGATVSLVDGPEAGKSTISDASGKFSFAGSFENPTAVKVTKDGYIPSTAAAKAFAPGQPEWAYVQLDEVAVPVDLIGEYTLTLTADSGCSEDFPSELRTRSYPASIAPTPGSPFRAGSSLTLTVGGASFAGQHNSFPIGVAGDTVAFEIYNGEEFGIVEQIVPGTFLAIQGQAVVSVGVAPVTTSTTPLSGIIDYCALSAGNWNYDCNGGVRIGYERCTSTHHQLTLTRR
jgi:hypothetical protein